METRRMLIDLPAPLLDHVKGYAIAHNVTTTEVITFSVWKTFYDYACTVEDDELISDLEQIFGLCHQYWENLTGVVIFAQPMEEPRF